MANLCLCKHNFSLYFQLNKLFKFKRHETIIRTLSLSVRKRRDEYKLPEPIPAVLHIVGNGSTGNGRGVFLDIGDKMYLFNCGEGLQRLAFEHNIKLSKLQNIFFTANEWQNVSGLSGLSLTCYDSRVKQQSWHCLPSLNGLHKIWKFFDIKLRHFDVNIVNSITEGFNDENVEIKSILIESNHLEPVLSFVCKLHARNGVFRIDKCFHLKVPRNLVPKLESREDLILENRIVKYQDVHTPDEEEQTIVVVDCPTDEYIELIKNNQQLKNTIKSNVTCVIHFSPENVVNNDLYQNWINQFSSLTKHIMINKANPSLSLFHAHRFQSQLNLLNDSIFPLIQETQCDNSLCERDNRIFPPSGLKFILRPSKVKGLNFKNIDILNTKECQMEMFERDGFAECYKKLKSEMSKMDMNKSEEFPEIVFLGTGSALPGTFRNVSSILVNISDNTSMILDCGEDTYGQLFRFYGPENIKSVLTKIKAIFVSHIHSDHHCGIVTLMKERYEITKEKIFIIIPPLLSKWLDMYSEECEDISHIYTHRLSPQLANYDTRFLNLELKLLKTVRVPHCSHAYGVVMVTDNDVPRKIVYSGDAIPCESLIEMGKDCDLLIHEATYDDSLIETAKEKMHCTISQVIDVAKCMNAKFTILTHFSQRYGKLPLIPDDLNNDFGIAFDFMKVRVSDLSALPCVIPSLNCLYSKHIEDLKMREENRLRKLNVNFEQSMSLLQNKYNINTN